MPQPLPPPRECAGRLTTSTAEPDQPIEDYFEILVEHQVFRALRGPPYSRAGGEDNAPRGELDRSEPNARARPNPCHPGSSPSRPSCPSARQSDVGSGLLDEQGQGHTASLHFVAGHTLSRGNAVQPSCACQGCSAARRPPRPAPRTSRAFAVARRRWRRPPHEGALRSAGRSDGGMLVARATIRRGRSGYEPGGRAWPDPPASAPGRQRRQLLRRPLAGPRLLDPNLRGSGRVQPVAREVDERARVSRSTDTGAQRRRT